LNRTAAYPERTGRRRKRENHEKAGENEKNKENKKQGRCRI